MELDLASIAPSYVIGSFSDDPDLENELIWSIYNSMLLKAHVQDIPG